MYGNSHCDHFKLTGQQLEGILSNIVEFKLNQHIRLKVFYKYRRMIPIESTMDRILQFRDERDWKQFHNLKDLAISLSIESSELLENFQWKTTEDAVAKNSDKIEDELADVLIYAILMANDLGVDMEDIILRKLEINRLKYPVDKYKGTAAKSTEIIDGESLS